MSHKHTNENETKEENRYMCSAKGTKTATRVESEVVSQQYAILDMCQFAKAERQCHYLKSSGTQCVCTKRCNSH